MLNAIKKNKNIILLMIGLISLNFIYVAINRMNMQVYSVKIFIDDYIPFVKYMIIPYDLWYFYIWGITLYLLFKDKELFVTHSKSVIISKTICMIIYLIYPTYVVRPEITDTDIFSRLIQITYSNDNPVNVFPSIHVLVTILTHIAVLNIKNIKGYIKIILWIFSLLVILSTVMIKQHYFLDVVGGYLLAYLTAKFVYGKKHENYEMNTFKVMLRNQIGK